jgi:hypothetical protein
MSRVFLNLHLAQDIVARMEKRKDPHAVALGRKGGKARLQRLTSEQRRDIARKAVAARWAKVRAKKEQSD